MRAYLNKTIGFAISHKENENRRAVLPYDFQNVKNVNRVYIEKGYGNVLGFSDNDYSLRGCNIANRDKILKCDIICDPKIGDADYLEYLNNQTIFGWIHAVQNVDITKKIVVNKLTAYAWEDMFNEGRHVFWRNNELAGEAAIMDAFKIYGKMPYECKVAVLGRGNTAQGAMKILTLLGADITNYGRQTENLFKKEINKYDVIVNCILWDTSRKDHIIYCKDTGKMKKGSMIVDISCDRNGGIEFSVPTTINNPVYYYNGILVYAVDHTPTLFYKTASSSISSQVFQYIDLLIDNNPDDVLKKAKIIENGIILDNRIVNYHNKYNK